MPAANSGSAPVKLLGGLEGKLMEIMKGCRKKKARYAGFFSLD